MSDGTLALLIHGGTDNWSPERWKARFDAVCADRPVFLLPDENLDPAEVRYAAVWKPRAGELAGVSEPARDFQSRRRRRRADCGCVVAETADRPRRGR